MFRWFRQRVRWIVLSLIVCGFIGSCQWMPPNLPAGQSTVIVRSAYGALGELFQTEVVNFGLAALGYQVIDGLEIEYDVLHEAIARGYLEYTASHWHTLHTDFFDQGQGNLKRAGTLLDNARQGYLIDAQTADEEGITNLEQFQDPLIASRFDIDGNGQADLIGCDEGWGCHTIIEHHLDAYGLRDTVEHRFGEYDDLIKTVVMERIEQGLPILYYTWTPYWVSGELQPGIAAQWLAVPFTDLPGNNSLTEADTTVEGINLGFAVDQIQILANRNFLAEHPDIAAYFQAVQMSSRDVSLQNQRMVQDQEASLADIRNYAQTWIETNQSQFNSWLDAARQAS